MDYAQSANVKSKHDPRPAKTKELVGSLYTVTLFVRGKRLKPIIAIFIIVSVLFLFTGCVFHGKNDYRESMVETSPIADLSSDDISRVPYVINHMEREGLITHRRIRERPGASQLIEVHNFNWIGSNDTRLMVGVSFFETEQGAIDFIPSETIYRNSQQQVIRIEDDSNRRPYTLMFYNNGAEARLGDSYRVTDEYGFTIYWIMNSSLRLENIRINMTEHRYRNNFDDPAASEFIKQLCEMLMAVSE